MTWNELVHASGWLLIVCGLLLGFSVPLTSWHLLTLVASDRARLMSLWRCFLRAGAGGAATILGACFVADFSLWGSFLSAVAAGLLVIGALATKTVGTRTHLRFLRRIVDRSRRGE